MAVHGPSHSVHVVKLSIAIGKEIRDMSLGKMLSLESIFVIDEKKICLRPKICRRRPCFLFGVPRHAVLSVPLLSYLNRGGGFQSRFASRITTWQHWHVPLSRIIKQSKSKPKPKISYKLLIISKRKKNLHLDNCKIERVGQGKEWQHDDSGVLRRFVVESEQSGYE
jgi:hypothetical protein